MVCCILETGCLHSLHGTLGVVVLEMAGNIEYVFYSFAQLNVSAGQAHDRTPTRLLVCMHVL